MSGRKIWTILLALWFLLYGFLAVTNVTIQFTPIIMGFLAILIALFFIFGQMINLSTLFPLQQS